jgi:transposase
MSGYWERTGFCLFATRVERGRFRCPRQEQKQELSTLGLQLLLDGIALGRRHTMEIRK